MDYKKYSLENLEKWIEDAINSSEASPQEIYDVIKNVVSDNYYCYKNHTERCYKLLALLNGNGNSFNIDPKGNNLDGLIENPIFNIGNPWDNMSLSSAYGNLQTSSLICDKDDKSPECQKSWNDFWEENYYPEEYKKNKVKRWVLPVQEIENGDTMETEYFINLPDDLLDQTGWKENDDLNWDDNGDGTFTLTKSTKLQ